MGAAQLKDLAFEALRRENEALREECERYRRLAAADPSTGLCTRTHFDGRLRHEWSRAKRFWTPLSLLWVDASALIAAPWALATTGRFLAARRREVDIAARVTPLAFAVILPSTNRTGAEAELARLHELAEQQLDHRYGRIGFGLAIAFDEASTSAEMCMIAERAAEKDRNAPDPHETPTVPHLSSPTWIDPAEPVTLLT